MRSSPRREAEPLLQVEVGDSIGLPLPDARLELYTRMDRALFREWVPIEPGMLGAGIHLLRFSHPGYRPSVFSVPLREGSRVSVRVRLMADSGTTSRKAVARASEVHAVGVATRGKESTDIIGNRRVLDREAIEAADAANIGELMQVATGTGLRVEGSAVGMHQVTLRNGPVAGCGVHVMINGDATLLLSFSRFEELYRLSEAETIEIVPRLKTLPYYFRRSDSECGLLMVWLTGRQL